MPAAVRADVRPRDPRAGDQRGQVRLAVQPRGHVVIAWKVDRSAPEALLRFSWTERGGPPATPPKAAGLGTQLISLLGTSQAAFSDAGFEYALQVPLAEAVRGTEDARPFAAAMPR